MPKHSLLRLSTKIHNTPHLITTQAFDVILDYLEARNSKGIQMLMPMGDDSKEEEDTPDDMDDFDESPLPIVVIDVCGTLTYKPVETMCGEVGTSYQSLQEDVESAIEDGATTIIMNFSSGGGEASHVFETVEEIRKMCDETGVTLLGYIDTMACSAAYAIAAACDELYINPSASSGSIGCVISLLDTSKAMEMEGYKRIYITSGENKVPFAEDGSFKKSFIDGLQKSVDKLNNEFTDHVAKYTGLSTSDIKGFEAEVFDAEDSLSNGLVTGIMTNKEFVKYVVDKQKGTM